MAENPPQLDYAPTPDRRRRVARWIGLVVLLALLALLLLKWSFRAYETERIRRLYDRCAAFQRPAGTVVFDEAAKNPRQPFVWDDFLLAASSSRILSQGTLFLGELRNSWGRRLVGVDLNHVNRSIDVEIATSMRSFKDVSALRVPRQAAKVSYKVALWRDSQAGPLRLFAGQVDPTDPAHFTIPFLLGEKPGVIDGWLRDDESVLMQVRPESAP